MSKDEKYYWCELSKGTTTTYGYVEERAAKLNAQVELVDYGTDLWKVVSVSNEPVTKEFVRSKEKLYKQFQGSLRGGTID